MLRGIGGIVTVALLVLGAAACAAPSTAQEEFYDRVEFFVEKARACDFESDLLEPIGDSVYFDWSLLDIRVHKTMTFAEYLERLDEARADIEARIERELDILERECS